MAEIQKTEAQEEAKKPQSKGFFDKDNGLNRTLTLIGSLILANIYFVLCSIPVLTMGASLTALNHVCYRLAEGEELRVTKTFFSSFVKALLDATLIWVIGLGVLSALGFGIYQFIVHSEGATQVIGAGVCGIGAILAAIVLTYYFAVLARYQNMIMTQIKDAFIIGFVNLGWTIVIWVIWGVAIGVFVVFREAIIYLGWIWLVIGFAALVYVTAKIYHKIFRKFETKED